MDKSNKNNIFFSLNELYALLLYHKALCKLVELYDRRIKNCPIYTFNLYSWVVMINFLRIEKTYRDVFDHAETERMRTCQFIPSHLIQSAYSRVYVRQYDYYYNIMFLLI
jgi:hypothetical protein